jgi:hypothetical protein
MIVAKSFFFINFCANRRTNQLQIFYFFFYFRLLEAKNNNMSGKNVFVKLINVYVRLGWSDFFFQTKSPDVTYQKSKKNNSFTNINHPLV